MTNNSTTEIIEWLQRIYHETTAVLRRDWMLTKDQIWEFKDFPFDKLIPKWELIWKLGISDRRKIFECLMKEWVFKLGIGGRMAEMSHIPMEFLSVYEVRARKTLLKQYWSEFLSVWRRLSEHRSDNSWIDLNCRIYERYIGLTFDTAPVPEDRYNEQYSATWEKFQKLIHWIDWLQTNRPDVLEEHIPWASNFNPVLLIEWYDQYVDSM